MKSWAEKHVFLPLELAKFREATRMVEELREPANGAPPWRCHEVARVVGKRLGLAVLDGKYGSVDHSWLVFPGSPRLTILDVYAVGSLPIVRLVDVERLLPHEALYSPGPTRTDVRFDDVVILEGVEAFVDGAMTARGFERHPVKSGTWLCREIEDLHFRAHTVRRWVLQLWPNLEACRKKFSDELDAAVQRATAV